MQNEQDPDINKSIGSPDLNKLIEEKKEESSFPS